MALATHMWLYDFMVTLLLLPRLVSLNYVSGMSAFE